MLTKLFENIRYSAVMVVVLTFNPLFAANILNHINDDIKLNIIE